MRACLGATLRRLLGFSVVASLAVASLAAETIRSAAVDRLSYEQAIVLAEEGNGEEPAEGAAVHADHDVQPSPTTPPVVSFETEVLSLREPPFDALHGKELAVSLEWDVALTRSGVAWNRFTASHTDFTKARLRSERRERQLRAALAYSSVVLAQERMALARQYVTALGRLDSESVSDQLAAALIRVERLQAQADLHRTEHELAAARDALRLLLLAPGLRADFIATTPLALPSAAVLEGLFPGWTQGRLDRNILRERAASRPDAVAARQQEHLRRLAAHLAQAGSPAITLKTSYEQRFGMSGVSLGVSLPVAFGRRQASNGSQSPDAARFATRPLDVAIELEIDQAAEAVERHTTANSRAAHGLVEGDWEGPGDGPAMRLTKHQVSLTMQRARLEEMYEIRVALLRLAAAVGIPLGQI